MLGAAAMLAWTACSDEGSAPPAGAWARGQLVYKNVCVACHNPDPSLQGALGPAIAGSSRELVEARLVRGSYPEGYLPKLPSKAMPAFPHLAGSVDDLTAFLNDRGDGG
jgi:mono/diheme cytochrome c family protein